MTERPYLEDFYDILVSRDIKTYHINSQMFYDNFLPYAKNKDEVIYICFSTGIAGPTMQQISQEELLEVRILT